MSVRTIEFDQRHRCPRGNIIVGKCEIEIYAGVLKTFGVVKMSIKKRY